MNDRERFLAVMDYRAADRCVYGVMTGGLAETYERWRGEGVGSRKEPGSPRSVGLAGRVVLP